MKLKLNKKLFMKLAKIHFDSYVNHLKNNRKGLSEDVEITPTFDRTFLLNQETMEMANKLTEYVNPKTSS